nr:unnamed protein product [Callosobruchus analis]
MSAEESDNAADPFEYSSSDFIPDSEVRVVKQTPLDTCLQTQCRHYIQEDSKLKSKIKKEKSKHEQLEAE